MPEPAPSHKQQLFKLQVELCKLQSWLRQTGERAIVIFEGRDTAGKGGMIRTITERVSHRVFRSVALPTPSDRERGEWYMQRYVQHFPSAGEVTLFDRSWYNRAGVERVMGFCSEAEVNQFLEQCPGFEKSIVNSGTRLIKYWLDIEPETQRKRLEARVDDPRKQWKLSALDLEAQRRWYDYSRARDEMFRHTDTGFAPWYVVRADDSKRSRLNCIAHLLSLFPYREQAVDIPRLPGIDQSSAYDDRASIGKRRFIPEPL